MKKRKVLTFIIAVIAIILILIFWQQVLLYLLQLIKLIVIGLFNLIVWLAHSFINWINSDGTVELKIFWNAFTALVFLFGIIAGIMGILGK